MGVNWFWFATPVPNAPSWSLPQTHTLPAESTAIECASPAAMRTISVPDGKITPVGVAVLSVEPIPSWPESFSPQAQTVPLERRARE